MILGTIKRNICGIKQIDDFIHKIKKIVGEGVFEVIEENREYLYSVLEKEINTFINRKSIDLK